MSAEEKARKIMEEAMWDDDEKTDDQDNQVAIEKAQDEVEVDLLDMLTGNIDEDDDQ